MIRQMNFTQKLSGSLMMLLMRTEMPKLLLTPEEIDAPGMLNAVFTAKATEPGGDESITQTTIKYAPYPVFAGINLPGLKGKEQDAFH